MAADLHLVYMRILLFCRRKYLLRELHEIWIYSRLGTTFILKEKLGSVASEMMLTARLLQV